MPIERLVETKKPRFVVDQILSSIQDGSLSAGERLPSEAKLAELTGVGAGSFVSATLDGGAMSSDIANEIAKAISASEEAHQLQEARAVFECGLVRLAATRWSQGKAESFEDLLSQMSSCADRECYEDYIRLHRNFHLMLAQATDNAIVEGTERSFLEYMDHEGWQDMERQFYLPNRREILSESVSEHASIIDAVSSGDAVAAADRMHEHFQRYE